MNFTAKLLAVTIGILTTSSLSQMVCEGEGETCPVEQKYEAYLTHLPGASKSNCKEPIDANVERDHYQCLVEQILDHGGEINKVARHRFEDNYGLVATEDIPKGELVTYIPREFLITARDAVQQSDLVKAVGKGLLAQLEFANPELVLIMVFLME